MNQNWICNDCELSKTKGDLHVLGSGPEPDKAKALVVVEAPSFSDSQTGYLVSGDKARETLVTMLAEAGLTLADIAIVSLVACCPPRNEKTKASEKLLDSQIEACWPKMEFTINFYKPKFVMLMGAVPTKVFLGLPALARAAGKVYDSADCRGLGFALSGEQKKVSRTADGVKTDKMVSLNRPGVFKVMATQSPMAVLRDPGKQAEALFAMKQFGDLMAGRVAEKPALDYRIGYTEPEVYDILTQVYERTKTETRMAFDIETSGFFWYQRKFNSFRSTILSCAFGFRPYEVFGVCLRPAMRSLRIMSLFQKILQTEIPKGGHNGKFDNVFIRGELGWEVKNFVFDTMTSAYGLDQEANIGLGDLAPIYRPDLGRYWEDIESKYLDRKRTGYLNAPDSDLLPYNCKDVDVTLTLWDELPIKMNTEGKEQLFHEILMPHQYELEQMEYWGVRLDIEKTKELGRAKLVECQSLEVRACEALDKVPEWWGYDPATMAMHGLTKEVYDAKKLNLNSGPQLGKLLYETLKLPAKKFSAKPDKAGKRRPSVDEEALEAIKKLHPAIPIILEWRGVFKQLSTYIGWERRDDGTEGVKTEGTSLLALVDVNDRVHFNAKIHGTGTGRISVEKPNLQNQPKTKVFRDLFLAAEGYMFVDSDFSGLELRILANISNDEGMIDTFLKKIDPHSATASEMFGIPVDQIDKDGKERKAGKTLNFGIAYGKGAPSVAEELGITKEEAAEYLAKWARARPQATKWIKAQHEFVKTYGFVRYSLNRTRPLPGIKSDDGGIRGNAERCSVNTPIQGTGSDCTSIAIIRVGQRSRKDFGPEVFRPVLEVHDQIISEVKIGFEDQGKAMVIEEMEKPMPMLSPALGLEVDCKVKQRWGDGMK